MPSITLRVKNEIEGLIIDGVRPGHFEFNVDAGCVLGHVEAELVAKFGVSMKLYGMVVCLRAVSEASRGKRALLGELRHLPVEEAQDLTLSVGKVYEFAYERDVMEEARTVERRWRMPLMVQVVKNGGGRLRKLRLTLARYHTVRALQAAAVWRLGPGSLQDAHGRRLPLDMHLSQLGAEDIVFEEILCKTGGSQIFVKTPTGKTVTFVVNITATLVEDLKMCVYHKEKFSVAHQRLIFGGRQLENGRTLHDYNITKECTVHVVMRLCGGMFVDKNGTEGFKAALPSRGRKNINYVKVRLPAED